MDGPKERSGQRGGAGTGPESSEETNLNTNDSTVIELPRNSWQLPMRRAYAIRKYRGRAKVYAVKLWRVSVQDALEVRR